MEFVLLAALLGLGYYAYKHYATQAQVAAVKALLSTIDTHVKAEYAIVKPILTTEEARAQATVMGIIQALKSKLGVK